MLTKNKKKQHTVTTVGLTLAFLIPGTKCLLMYNGIHFSLFSGFMQHANYKLEIWEAYISHTCVVAKTS